MIQTTSLDFEHLYLNWMDLDSNSFCHQNLPPKNLTNRIAALGCIIFKLCLNAFLDSYLYADPEVGKVGILVKQLSFTVDSKQSSVHAPWIMLWLLFETEIWMETFSKWMGAVSLWASCLGCWLSSLKVFSRKYTVLQRIWGLTQHMDTSWPIPL